MTFVAAGLLWGTLLAANEPPAPPLPTGMPDIAVECEGARVFDGTQVERAAWCNIREGTYANARTLSERALAANSLSWRAHTLLGIVQHLGESNLPRALYHQKKSEQLFLQDFPLPPEPGNPAWFVHRLTLLELISVLGEMNEHTQQIFYVDTLKERLGLDYNALKAWPLIKLRRYDEARQVAMGAIQQTDESSRDMREDGLTALCAIESELRRREAAYQACMNAARDHLEDDPAGGVALVNAGIASLEVHRFDTAERMLIEATRREVEGTINPWAHLTHLYVRQGRLPEALSALREVQAYRRRRPAHMDQQDQADAELTGAVVLLVSGRGDDALRITNRVIHRPERLGSSSASAEQHEAGNFLMDRTARLEAARRLEERAVTTEGWDWWSMRAQALWMRVEAWADGRRAATLLRDEDMLVASVRPDCPGSVEIPVWLDGDLVDVMGPGVILAALERARAEENLPVTEAAPYFDALAAEAFLTRGDSERALTHARSALEGLHRTEVLLRARVAAIAARAARELGRWPDSVSLVAAAFQADPGVFRRTGMPLPVQIGAEDTSATALRAVKILKDSPRFDDAPWGLTLMLTEGGARLTTPDGSEIGNVIMDPPAPGVDPAEALVDAVHERLLSPRLDVTQADIRSLDGSIGAGGEARSKAQELLEDVLRAPPR